MKSATPFASTSIGVLLLVALAACGGEPVLWQCSFDADSGVIVLDTDRVKFIFEGIEIKPSKFREGGGSTSSLQIAGPGTSEQKMAALDKTLVSSYAGGKNTLTIDKFSLVISDRGGQVTVAGKSFEIGAEKQTIRIHGDGSATLEARGGGDG